VGKSDESGGEGMAVKSPIIAKNKRGLVQPAVRCRAKEYLRTIYGSEYIAPYNLERLRPRGLSAKRSLSASSRSASNPCSGSSNMSLCAASISAHLQFSSSKASL
jgi:hypothetical protein